MLYHNISSRNQWEDKLSVGEEVVDGTVLVVDSGEYVSEGVVGVHVLVYPETECGIRVISLQFRVFTFIV